MPRHLLILRHAKSSWAETNAEDWERPLNERGERDAPRVGAGLRRLKLLPDLIVTSDAVRAESTARAAAEAAGYEGRIVLSPELYHASPQAIVDVVRTLAGTAGTVLIVGHNPGLEDLVGRLTGGQIDLPTATLVHLALPIDQWSDASLSTDATLVGAWRPGDL
jgi:phosphohistidine phosphatase